MKRDPIHPPGAPGAAEDYADDHGDGVTYVECLLLGQPDPLARGAALGRALITPCHAAEDGLDELQRLRLYAALIAFLLGVAENSLGPDGREAIVQTMRNTPAARDLMLAH